MKEDETKEMLSEAFHTAFRKATEWKGSHEIWKLIQKMPDGDWGTVIDFVYDTVLKEKEYHERDSLLVELQDLENKVTSEEGWQEKAHGVSLAKDLVKERFGLRNWKYHK